MEDFHQHAVWRQFPPGMLARAAARRAYRRARQVLYRHSPPLTSEQLLRSLGMADAAALAREALTHRTGSGWCEISQREGLREILSVLPQARERAYLRARAALERSFDVFGRKICFGKDGKTQWSLDAEANRLYPSVAASQIQLLQPGWDPKYAWVLGRLDHLVALGQGYWIGDANERGEFAQAFVTELSDFIRMNPAGVGVHWTCPMEVALRGANMAQALALFADAPEVSAPDFVISVLKSLAEHVDFVEANLEDASAVPNNHLVANYVGLWVVGLLFPQLPRAKRHIALARTGLVEEMKRQVHWDGVSFENSIGYHRLSVELFSLAYLFARAHGEDLGEEFRGRLRRMYYFSRAYCSSKGLAPQLGDNDSGRAFSLCDRKSLEHGYLGPLGAAMFGEPGLKSADDVYPDEAVWLLGREGFQQFQHLPSSARTESCFSTGGGFAILRGGEAVVTASVGGSGQGGVGGHSHCDKLSFELHLHGRPVIVDPGTATYSRDPALRNAFRSTSAHNCLQLDGREQTPFDPAKLFALPDVHAAEVIAFERTAAWQRLTARHRGYLRLSQPAEVCRTWLLDLGRQALGVVDAVESAGRHLASVRLQFPHRAVRVRRASAAERARASGVFPAPRDFAADAVELQVSEALSALILFDANTDWALSASTHSPGYGEQTSAMALTLRRSMQGPAQLGWAVLWGVGLRER